MEYSVNNETSLLEEKVNVSDKTVQVDNRKTVSSKEFNEERLVLLATKKAEAQKVDEFQDQRSEPGPLQIEELDSLSQQVETRSNITSGISKISSARRVLYLKVKTLKEQNKLQARLEKLKPAAIQREIADLHEELSRKARIAEIETEIAEGSSSQGTSFRSISPTVDSVAKISSRMDRSETDENESKSNIAVSVHSTPQNCSQNSSL